MNNKASVSVLLLVLLITVYGHLANISPVSATNYGIPDPHPEENSLGSDWARHPQDSGIYNKSVEIADETPSSYEAAFNIYQHVLSHFYHTTSGDISFRKDLDLLNELATSGQYTGVCRSDAVILTAYARALGIPARIIHLHVQRYGHTIPPGELTYEDHYFAELYVLHNGVYQWIPVDADPWYNWFGINEANQKINLNWPYSRQIGPHEWEQWRITFVHIVTDIPYGGIVDEGFTWVPYSDQNLYDNHDHTEIPDIAVTNVTPSKTIAGKGYSVSVNAEVENQGNITQNCFVTAYYGATTIGTQTIKVPPKYSKTITFLWNTTDTPYGNYTISAYATPVSGEIDTADNTYTGGNVLVTIPGDVNGDRTVNVLDLGVINAHWYPGPPQGPLGYDPNVDINNDGAINVVDAAIVSAHWGQSW